MPARCSLRLLTGVALLGGLTVCAGERLLRGPAKPGETRAEKVDLNDLQLEVNALQTLYQLRTTRAQLEDLARRARDTAQEPGARQNVTVSDAYRKTLLKLRDALRADDEERVGELNHALDELHAKEKPEFDDAVEITEEARKQAPAVLRRLSVRQVAGYLADYADDFPDPKARLIAALDKVRKRTGAEARDHRDAVAGEVAWLVAGLDPEAEEGVRERAVELLDRARRLDDADFKTSRAELEKEADLIAGRVGPVDVMRHFLERALAELLSNPRLEAAVKGRLKRK